MTVDEYKIKVMLEGNVSQKGDDYIKKLKGISTAGNNIKHSFKGMNSAVGAVGIGFGVRELFALGKQAVLTAAKFEKFKTMLKQGLGGSVELTNETFSMIKQFALQTPNSVEDITESMIRLQNNGVKPNIKMLQHIGDISAALGKDFTKTTEAFLDLGRGQTKRIEEIGISVVANRKTKEFDLFFKNQRKSIKQTQEGAIEALNWASTLPGIGGTAKEVSRTTSGLLNNIGDKWDQILSNIGNNQGFKNMLTLLDTVVSKTLKLTNGNEITSIISSTDYKKNNALVNKIIANKNYYDNLLKDPKAKLSNEDKIALDYARNNNMLDRKNGVESIMLGSSQKERNDQLKIFRESNFANNEQLFDNIMDYKSALRKYRDPTRDKSTRTKAKADLDAAGNIMDDFNTFYEDVDMLDPKKRENVKKRINTALVHKYGSGQIDLLDLDDDTRKYLKDLGINLDLASRETDMTDKMLKKVLPDYRSPTEINHRAVIMARNNLDPSFGFLGKNKTSTSDKKSSSDKMTKMGAELNKKADLSRTVVQNINIERIIDGNINLYSETMEMSKEAMSKRVVESLIIASGQVSAMSK